MCLHGAKINSYVSMHDYYIIMFLEPISNGWTIGCLAKVIPCTTIIFILLYSKVYVSRLAIQQNFQIMDTCTWDSSFYPLIVERLSSFGG